jgi:NADH-quinone oxidoreductase subunit C
LSSPENPTAPEGEGNDEPAAGDLTASPGAQAEIERADADDTVDAAAAATPGDPTTAADRGPIEAPGSPGEPSSDADVTSPAPSPTPAPADEGAPESSEAGAATGGTPADAAPAAEPATGGAAAGITPDQPPPTADARAKEAATHEVEVSAAEKEAQAAAAADVVAKAEPTPGPATAEPETPAVEGAPEPEPDERQAPILDALRQHLGDELVATRVKPGVDIWARVTPGAWRRAAEVCRDHLGMTYFGYLSAIDWLPSPFGKSEDGGLGRPAGDEAEAPVALEEHGYTGGTTRFQLIARLQSPTSGLGVHLKCDLPDDDLRVETWSKVFAGSDWHERETAEMFGIDFAGHPNLVKLYLPGEFEGHPLRKDFPLLAREVKPWPGLVDVEPMPGEDEPAASEAGT